MKADPLPENPTNADLGRHQIKIHECLDTFGDNLREHIARAEEIWKGAARDRRQIANSVKRVGKIVTADRAVAENRALTITGQLQALSDQVAVDGTARDNTLATAIEKLDGVAAKVDGFEQATKTIKWLARAVIGAVMLAAALVSIANYAAGHDQATIAELNARTSDRYTAEDAARDRKLQQDRDAQIVAALQRLEARR